VRALPPKKLIVRDVRPQSSFATLIGYQTSALAFPHREPTSRVEARSAQHFPGRDDADDRLWFNPLDRKFKEWVRRPLPPYGQAVRCFDRVTTIGTSRSRRRIHERSGIVMEVTGRKRGRVFSYRRHLAILSEETDPLP